MSQTEAPRSVLVVASDAQLMDRISTIFGRGDDPVRAVDSITRGMVEMSLSRPRMMAVGFRYRDLDAAAQVERLVNRAHNVFTALILACPVAPEGQEELPCDECVRGLGECKRRSRLVILGAHDYLRLARSSGASMMIERHRPSRVTGQITLHEGELWAASDSEGAGEDALFRLLDPSTPALFSTRILTDVPGEQHFVSGQFGPPPTPGRNSTLRRSTARRVTGPHFPSGMIHAANETLNAAISAAERSATTSSSRPTKPRRRSLALTNTGLQQIVTNPDFSTTSEARRVFNAQKPPRHARRFVVPDDASIEQIVTIGLEAVLERHFEQAAALFARAASIDPDYPKVAATLTRLEKLGYAGALCTDGP